MLADLRTPAKVHFAFRNREPDEYGLANGCRQRFAQAALLNGKNRLQVISKSLDELPGRDHRDRRSWFNHPVPPLLGAHVWLLSCFGDPLRGLAKRLADAQRDR